MRRVSCLLMLAACAMAADSGPAAAQALLDRGRADEAEAAAAAWLDAHPDDQQARRVLLAARIARSQEELHALGPGPAAVPDEARLDRARDLLAWRRFAEALALSEELLRSYPEDREALRLKVRAQEGLQEGSRARLDAEQRRRDGEAIDDVLRAGTFPRDKPMVRRQVFVFDEDMDELERQRVRNRLQEVVTLDFQGVAARPVIEKLFAVAGINYVLLDSALGDHTLTLHLYDETVETALDAVAKLVKLRYSYVRGTVFVSGEDDGQLVTEIIRLRSGLTDVDAQVAASVLGGAGAAGGGPSVLPNGAQTNTPAVNPFGAPPAPAPAPAANQAQNAAAGGGKSDLERFIEKLPDIVVGWPSEGKLYLDRKSNTLYVRATPHAISEVKRLLTAIDYDNVQVLIEARFVEVAESALRQLGVSWQIADSIPVGANTKVNAIGGTPVAPSAVASNGGLVFSGLTSVGRANILASLSALEKAGKSHSLAEPKILTLNNSRGLIEVTRDISYISGYTNQGTGSSPVTTGTTTTYINNTALVPQFAKDSDGISLAITPSVARNSDVITLRLEPKVKVLITPPTDVEFNMIGANGETVVNKISQPPEFTTRSLVTSLHIQNGQTVALGGLVNQTDSENTTGIPFLSKIPLLGQLFRTDTSDRDRRNLIILVSATQVEPSGAKVGGEIERLRSTARVVLPDEARQALEVSPLSPDSLPASVPANPNRGGSGGKGFR